MLIFIIILIVIFILFKCVFKNNSTHKEVENSKSNESDPYKTISNEIYNEKIRSFVEKMTLNELMQLLPEEIFNNTPKKRNLLNEALIKEIQEGRVEMKMSEGHYYVDSDRILENDKDYYYDGINERKSNVKHFSPIVRDTSISRNMDIFANINYDDINIDEIDETDKNIKEEIPSLEEKIKYALTLEPIKKNYTTFNTLLSEYNNLDFDSKIKISRKYTSELESLKNKAERSQV